MTIDQIAEQIFSEWDQPADTTAAAIGMWLSANIGLFNARMNTTVVVNNDGTFTPDLDDEQAAIYKKIYDLYRFNLLVKRNLGASGYDWSELTEGDSTIRRVSKSTIASSYRSLQNDAAAELKALIAQYRFDHALPSSLGGVGDVHQLYRVDLT